MFARRRLLVGIRNLSICPRPRFYQWWRSNAYLLQALVPLHATVLDTAPKPPSLFVAFSIITGLPAALWIYKCFMMVAFQRRIIYMGYAPLGARKEELKLDVHRDYLKGVSCEEIQVHNRVDNVLLSGLLVQPEGQTAPPEIVILYFQGNAGNPLHRIPVFQQLLTTYRSHRSHTALPKNNQNTSARPATAVVAVAPRSYWKSTNRRPAQAGLISDYHYALHYAATQFPNAHILLYGHSLGGAAAICLLSQLPELSLPERSHQNIQNSPNICKRPQSLEVFPGEQRRSADVADLPEIDSTRIRGLILENTFTSVPDMLKALYPQRWTPYQYLTGFVWDRWDALGEIRAAVKNTYLNTDGVVPIVDSVNTNMKPDILIGQAPTSSIPPDGPPKFASVLGRLARNMLVLVSEHDEVVPPTMGMELARVAFGGIAKEKGGIALEVDARDHEGRFDKTKEVKKGREVNGGRVVVIPSALHDNAWTKREWSRGVGGYIEQVLKERKVERN